MTFCVSAQTPFKGEARLPTILVRIKQPAAVKPSAVPAAATGGRAKTYDDKVYLQSFEFTLGNGNDALKAGDGEDALGYFESAANISSDDPRPFIGAGAALLRQKKFADAMAKFRQAEALFTTTVGAKEVSAEWLADADQIYQGLGYAALMAANFDQSIAAYGRVTKLTGADGVGVHNNLGIALASLASYAEAEMQLKTALEQDSKARDVRFNLGMLYVVTRNRERATAILKELSTADPYRAGLLQRELEYLR
jgi:Flp pilus assembly protein TadD